MKKFRFQMYINDFAKRSFRDVGDQDYVAARASCRAGLHQPFLWSGLQALEKYLKAILVFNSTSARKLGHDLEKAFGRVDRIPDLPFEVTSDVHDFLRYLTRFGQDRYHIHPTRLREQALPMLDKSVWQVRRYCYNLRGTIPGPDGETVDLFPVEIKRIQDPYWQTHPERYRIPRGYLESIIKGKIAASYRALTWKNFFYGRRRKKRIRGLPEHARSSNPTHSLHPEIFPELEKLVEFPREVREFYRAEAKKL